MGVLAAKLVFVEGVLLKMMTGSISCLLLVFGGDGFDAVQLCSFWECWHWWRVALLAVQPNGVHVRLCPWVLHPNLYVLIPPPSFLDILRTLFICSMHVYEPEVIRT